MDRVCAARVAVRRSFVALTEGPAAGVAALDRTSVALVFFLAVLFLGEALTAKGAVDAVPVVAGAILLT